MKRIVVILYIFLVWSTISNCYAQMPTNGDFSDWDWENNNQDNWKRRDGSAWREIRPAFAPTTEKVNLMVSIYETQDFTKAKGWRLIFADFDGEYPYFVLYNVHKSIIRTYLYTEGQPVYSHMLVMLQCDNRFFRIFSGGDNGVNAIDSNNRNASTYVSCIIPGVGLNSWAIAEFPILFDNKNIGIDNYKWTISFYACDNFNIQLNVNGTLTPYLYTLSSESNPISGSTFNAGLTKFIAGVQSAEKLVESMHKSADKILENANNETILKDYANMVKGIKNYTDVVHAASSGASALGAVVGFVKTLLGTTDPARSTPPVAYLQQATVTGTMNIQRPLRSATLSIPGAYNYFPGNLPWQPYNCPVGIINLKKEPVIKRTTPFNRLAFAPDKMRLDYPQPNVTRIWDLPGFPNILFISLDTYPLTVAPGYQERYPGQYVKYKFDEDIELAKQNIDGLTLIDVKFALICKPSGTGDRKYKINTPYIAYHSNFYDVGGRRMNVPALNIVYDAIQKGRLIIHKYDEANDEIYFGTPYVSMNQFKGVTIDVPEDTDIKLGVLATFQSDLYDDLILFKTEYNIQKDPNPVKANHGARYGGWEQTNFLDADYFETKQHQLNNSGNSGNYTGKQIVLKPGFRSANGFRATARDYVGVFGNTVINSYSYNCEHSMRSSMASDDALDIEEVLADDEKCIIDLYPNPSSGVLFIKLPDGSPAVEIAAYSLSGSPVQTYTNVTSETVLDVSALPKGEYVFRIKTPDGFHGKRILIK